MAHPGAAAAANKAYFMQMKDKKVTAPAGAAGGEKSDKDLERERQREEEKAKLKEEIRLLREKEEKEASEKAAKAQAEAEAEARKKAELEASAPRPPPTQSAPAPAPTPAREEASVGSVTRQMESASVSQEPVGVLRLRAVVDYEATSPEELSYKKGDIIAAPPGTDTKGATCKGVLRGTAGTVSLANTEDPATGKRFGPPQMRKGVRCRAVGNYTAQAPDELSFKQGDIIFVTVCTPQPIWTGVFKGQVGKFPRRLVVDESGDPDSFPAPAAAAPAKFVKYVCVKQYTAKSPEEISINLGDVIQVANDTGEDFPQGACNGAFGRFPVDCTVNSAEFTKQQITQMIELEKKKAPKGGWVTFDSSAPAAPAATRATADPFAPQPLSSTPRGGDPFAVSSDPFAPQPSSASRTADPFAASPLTSFHTAPTHVGPSPLHHHATPLPLISAAAVQRALAESGPVLMTPPSPPRARAHTGSRRDRDPHHSSTPSSSAASGPASGQGSLTMIQSVPASGEDARVSTPIGPLSSE